MRVDHLLIARAADRSEAAVELGLRHEFRQIAKIRQQVGIAAGGGQQFAYLRRSVAGGAFTELHAGAIGGQVGETESGAHVGVFFLLEQTNGIGQPAAAR